jgi:hypothetical protein
MAIGLAVKGELLTLIGRIIEFGGIAGNREHRSFWMR